MAEFQTVQYNVQDGIAFVTFNRPRVLNAFSEQQREETRRAFRIVQADPAVRCVVIAGAGGRAFSAGQDINEAGKFTETDVGGWIDSWENLYKVIRETDVPVLASIRGYAVGAGLQVALCADIRISADDGRFGMTEIQIGIPCITGTATMWHLTSLTAIKDLILTGRLADAQEALRIGLVSRVVPQTELEATTLALARELAQKPATATRMNKQWWNALTDEVVERAREFGKIAHSRAFGSGDATEKMGEFLKRV